MIAQRVAQVALAPYMCTWDKALVMALLGYGRLAFIYFCFWTRGIPVVTSKLVLMGTAYCRYVVHCEFSYVIVDVASTKVTTVNEAFILAQRRYYK